MNKRPLLIVGILTIGVGLAAVLVKTAPKPQKKIQKVEAPLVDIAPIQLAGHRAVWQSGGAVNANTSVKLVSQVAGQVVEINDLALPGQFVKKGTILAQVDDGNYQFSVNQKQAALIQAQASLDMEKGQVQKALADYKLSGMKLKKEAKALALREPQLASAKAAVAIAKAELNKAKLDLSRTKLMMPFDGYVMSHGLSVGAYVNNATTAFTLIRSDEFWFEVKVPQSFIQVLDKQHPVKISKSGSDQTREANIVSILPQVDANDRQVRILLSIKNPLTNQNNEPQIRYNDYVTATLYAKEMPNALRVNTDQLNGQQHIWVVDQGLALQKRHVNVLYKGRKFSWVNIDMQPGDQLLVSSLPSKTSGMLVRLNKEDSNTAVASEESL